MKKRKIITLIGLALMPMCSLADFRRPQMPQGLTADKGYNSHKKPKVKLESLPPRSKPKRKGLQGYKKYHTLSDMTYDELYAAKEKARISKSWDITKYLEQMIILCDNINEKAALIIELADILFAQQKLDDAAKWYTEFTHLYPGNKQMEHASYKAIVCCSKRILSVDRDQSLTEKTLELASAFLKRADVFTTYKKQVETIQKECYQVLAQSDCHIAAFYLKYGSYQAAERRLKTIRNEWLDKVPEIGPQLTSLEVELAAQFSDFKAPEEAVKLAQTPKPIKKNDMTKRF